MTRVLVVDDSALMRKVLGKILGATDDLEVAFARDGVEAIEQVHAFQPDVVTLDVHMPRMDGLACLDRIMVERPCRVVMVSSLTAAGADVTLEAMQLGAVDFVVKPQGAISLALETFGPELVERVRAAASMRLRRSLRLKEQVRLRASGATAQHQPARPEIAIHAAPAAAAAAGQAPAATRWHARDQTGDQAGDQTGDQAGDHARDQAGNPAGDIIVLVGTSTGGPPALDALLSVLPADFPWPILVAQHMPASFTGPLARRLDRLCALQVVEVTRSMPLAPGTAYIGRGGADIIVAMRPGGPVAMAAPASAHRWHPSVDRLVTSAMQHLPPSRLVGVLMTGMGDDGAAAMTRLRAAGGRTIAEAEATAVIWGMPGELVRAGGAEAVLPLEAIAQRLLDWAP